MTKPVLEVKNLNAWFGDSHIVKDISLSYHPGVIHAIIGPSGCGKSTYLRTLNRIHEEVENAKVSGEVILKGIDIYHPSVDPVAVRSHVGMVFQRPNPFPSMSIYDNVICGLKLRGEKDRHVLDEAVETSLKKAALWDEVKDKLNRDGSGLSGGQQQRLCIARAIAVNPDVLLMDEPTSALDPIASAKIEELMLSLKKDYTVIVVTHNMQQAARVADQTSFFVLGELIESGPSQQIFEAPLQLKTKEYVTGKFG